MRGQTRGGSGDLPRGRTGRPAHPGHLPANLAHTSLVALQRLAGDIVHRRFSSHRRRGQGTVMLAGGTFIQLFLPVLDLLVLAYWPLWPKD